MTGDGHLAATSRLVALGALLLAVSGCYLPRANVERDPSTFVLASVSHCSAESVGGAVRNDSDVSVRVVLKATWLDIASEVYHEVEYEVPLVEAESEIEWTASAGEPVEPPLLCEIEATEVEPLE